MVFGVVGVWHGRILCVRVVGRELRAGGRVSGGREAVGRVWCDRVGMYAIPVAYAVCTAISCVVAFRRG